MWHIQISCHVELNIKENLELFLLPELARISLIITVFTFSAMVVV